MKAVVIGRAGEAEVTQLEVPRIKPDEVLIRSRAIGICGSDVELYQGKRPEGYYRYPVVPGHEWAGEVVAVGESVRGVAPGNKVVAEGFVTCNTCRNCRYGATNLCETGYDEIGFTRPGGMAEYVAVAARQVHVLPHDASFEEAALLEPTSVVAQAFLRVQPRPGDVIVVLGTGTISLLGVQLAKLFSPAAIIVLGFREERLARARSMGATHTINMSREDPEILVRGLSDGRGADIVFEGAGHPQSVAEAIRLARRGGSVLLEGIAGGNALLHIEADIFALNHLAVYGIFGASTSAWTYSVQLFRSGLLNLAPLISHRFAIEEYPQALETLSARQEDTLKVLMLHS